MSMHKTERELLKRTKIDEQEKGEDRQDYLQRLCEAIDLLAEEDWEAMSDAAKEWTNTATRALKNKNALPDFDEDAAPKKAAPKKAAAPAKAKAKAAEEEEDAGEEETEEEVEDDEPAPKKAAKPAAKDKDKPRGMSAVAFVRQYVATHPEADVTEIEESAAKAGYNSLSRSSIGTIRSDFRSIARIIKEQGFLKKGVDLGV